MLAIYFLGFVMGKTKGIKYSSYLDNVGQLRLEKFCHEFDCSKAKAISYLLELWENGTVNNKLATVSEDIHAQFEQKIEKTIDAKLAEKFSHLYQEISDLKHEVSRLQPPIKKTPVKKSKTTTKK